MQRDAQKLRIVTLVSDMVWLAASLIVLCGIRDGLFRRGVTATALEMYLPILLAAGSGWCIIFIRYDLDGFSRGWRVGKIVSEIVVGVSILAALLCAVAFILHDLVSRLFIGWYCVLLAAGFLATRTGLRLGVRWLRRPRRRAIIVGNGRVAAELCSKLENHPEMRCEVVGFLYPRELQSASVVDSGQNTSIPVCDVGIREFLHSKAVTDVIIGPSGQHSSKAVLGMSRQCRDLGIRVSIVPQSYGLYDAKATFVDLEGLPVLQLQRTPCSNSEPIAKRALDLATVILLAPVVVPVLISTMIYLKVRTGKALVRAVRCGRGGAPYLMYRLNLIADDADRVCRLMKDLSITELPQIWNVLRGEMSIVGPRPETPERVNAYSEWHRQRLAVRPGLTGLAQVHGLRERNSSEEKARYDLEYIAHWSVFTDCILVIETAWTLSKRLLGVRRFAPRAQCFRARQEHTC